MGVSHRLQDVEKQTNARGEVEELRIARRVDGCAVHVLQDEIRLSGVGRPGIDEGGHVRMDEPGQDLALPPEARGDGWADPAGAQELERHLALVAPVAPVGEPDLAHAAMPDELVQRVGSDGRARTSRRELCPLAQEPIPLGHGVTREQFLELGRQARIPTREIAKPRRALDAVQ